MTKLPKDTQHFSLQQMDAMDSFLHVDKKVQLDQLNKLNYLIKQYMLNVPFENITVQNKEGVDINLDSLFHKIIESNRGGYCYEMNTLFKHYLLQKGYDACNVSATVRTPDGWARAHSHMSILVKLDRLYVADVGFGDLPTKSIPIMTEDEAIVIKDVNGEYRAVEVEGGFEVQKFVDDAFQTLYHAVYEPRDLQFFAESIEFNQHHPNSIFVKKLIVTKPLPDGRITMSERHLTVTRQSGKKVLLVTKDNYRTLLKQYFNMDVSIKILE